MKIASWNVNGIRSVSKKGFMPWFAETLADVVCVQEIKAFKEQLEDPLKNPDKYHSFWASAKKPGYSGVATFSKKEPTEVKVGIDLPEFDDEGRILTLEFNGLCVINTYFPNSQREGLRLAYKLDFCRAILNYCEELRKKGKHIVLCGDYNIAHTPIDLKNPKTNEKNAGYLPEERAWMTSFLEHGYIDTFRQFEPGPGHYTWWSYRPGVRENNIGWRIDYLCTNPEIKDRLKSSFHQPNVAGSDHCPVILELK